MDELVDDIRRLEFFEVDFVAVLDADGRQLAFSRGGPRLLNSRGQVESTRLNEVDVLSLLGSPVVAELRDWRHGFFEHRRDLRGEHRGRDGRSRDRFAGR